MRDRIALLAALALCAAVLPPTPAPQAAGQYATTSVPRMPLPEFKALLDQDAIVVIDVRSRDAYRAAHIPGALSVPLETVAARAAEWKAAGKPVVAYCA